MDFSLYCFNQSQSVADQEGSYGEARFCRVLTRGDGGSWRLEPRRNSMTTSTQNLRKVLHTKIHRTKCTAWRFQLHLFDRSVLCCANSKDTILTFMRPAVLWCSVFVSLSITCEDDASAAAVTADAELHADCIEKLWETNKTKMGSCEVLRIVLRHHLLVQILPKSLRSRSQFFPQF